MEIAIKIILTIGISMLPILEVRGGIPFGIGVLGLTALQAFLASIVGNILIVIILLKGLNPVTQFLMKHSKWFNRNLTKLFEKTRHKHSHRFNEVGALFLVTFVAIPLPATGAWTGSLIAYLFGIPFRTAFILISLGVIAAGILVSLGFESITSIIQHLS